jgi:hypothetical protein
MPTDPWSILDPEKKHAFGWLGYTTSPSIASFFWFSTHPNFAEPVVPLDQSPIGSTGPPDDEGHQEGDAPHSGTSSSVNLGQVFGW